jgi:hypothetical protein
MCSCSNLSPTGVIQGQVAVDHIISVDSYHINNIPYSNYTHSSSSFVFYCITLIKKWPQKDRAIRNGLMKYAYGIKFFTCYLY